MKSRSAVLLCTIVLATNICGAFNLRIYDKFEYRSISIGNRGDLKQLPDNEQVRLVQSRADTRWTLKNSKAGWVISRRGGDGRPEDKLLYLAYRTKHLKSEESDGTIIFLKGSQVPEDDCLWDIEIDKPKKGDGKYIVRCHAKAIAGDFKGWYLCIGKRAQDFPRYGRKGAEAWYVSLCEQRTEGNQLVLEEDGI